MRPTTMAARPWYKLTVDDLLKLEGYKKKSAENLINAIEKSKSNSLDKLLCGLGIKNIGSASAKLLCDSFGGIDSLIKASAEEIESVDGFGSLTAQAVVESLSEPHMLKTVEALKNAGVNMKYQRVASSDLLSGKIFVISGTLPTLKRDEAENIIQKNGGTVKTSVSKKTDFLLAGEGAGSKLTKARELGTKIIDEAQLFEMLGKGNDSSGKNGGQNMQIDIKHIAKLSRLKIEDSELSGYEREMADIIAMVEAMPDIEDELTVDPDNAMTLRPDEICGEKIPRDEILKNAPKTVAGCVVVPKTVD